jgi:hypothetical protein
MAVSKNSGPKRKDQEVKAAITAAKRSIANVKKAHPDLEPIITNICDALSSVQKLRALVEDKKKFRP